MVLCTVLEVQYIPKFPFLHLPTGRKMQVNVLAYSLAHLKVRRSHKFENK